MKKVRIMLSAVAVLAVLAGSYAFKANKAILRCVYTKNITGTTAPFTLTNVLAPTTTAATAPFATTATTVNETCPTQATVSSRWVITIE